MPRYSVISATKITDARTALLCARLHLRDGKHRLEKGLSATGIATLYDAVLFGMRYYIAGSGRCEGINISSNDLWDYPALYYKLAKAGVFDDPYAFNRLSLTVERALWQESFSFDTDAVLAEVEELLRKLGVIPFIESSRPSELLSVSSALIKKRMMPLLISGKK